MITFLVVLTFIVALLCATLAFQMNHSWVDWMITAVGVTLIIAFVGMIMPASQDRHRRRKVMRAVFGVFMTAIVIIGVAVGAAEFWERYTDGARFAVLDKWEIYGDALLRFTKSGENPPEAVTMKVAERQIDDYYSQLRDGMCWTMDDIELAQQGLRRSVGPRAILHNARRVFDLKKPEWPATVALTESETRARAVELTEKFEKYREYIAVIDSVRADTSATVSAN